MSWWRHTVSLTSQVDFARLFEVVGGNADCWTSMPNGWRPYFNINLMPTITYWWILTPLQEGKISIGTHTRCGPTMINTPWHARIDAQELFYFMILPVGGSIIDLAVSMKARLELYTDAHGTLIFDNYDECSPKNHKRTRRAEVGYHWLQHETTVVTASPRNNHENKTKWEFSALVSSRSLDERTAIESQGAVSIRKTVLPGMAIPMLKIRRPNGRLIFNMEIAIRR